MTQAPNQKHEELITGLIDKGVTELTITTLDENSEAFKNGLATYLFNNYHQIGYLPYASKFDILKPIN